MKEIMEIVFVLCSLSSSGLAFLYEFDGIFYKEDVLKKIMNWSLGLFIFSLSIMTAGILYFSWTAVWFLLAVLPILISLILDTINRKKYEKK